MISLEQWRAAVGGWNSRHLRAIYRRYGSRRMVRARNWARFQLAMELYSVDVYCSLYWLIVGLFAFFSSDGWRSATFDDICDFPLAIRRALIAAPTILVRHASRDNLPQLCALASPTAAPELRSSIVYLQRLWKLESPSVSSILRLLRALGWLLIVAGDVELNPGPVPPGLEKLLEATDGSVLTEDDLLSVYCEVLDLAPNWMDVGLVLGMRQTYLEEISTTYHESPRKCLKKALVEWLKQAYNVEKHGLPTWKKIVEVTAHPIAGNNPALAAALAQNHQGTTQGVRQNPKPTELAAAPSNAIITLYAQYLRSMYQAEIPTMITLDWLPPPTRKIFNLAMIREQTIRYGPIDEEMVRLTLRGRVKDILHQKEAVELKDIIQMDSDKRQVVLIEGAPGSGKSTLAWHVCQTWKSGKLFQNFRSVVYVQLRDPTIQSAKSVEDVIPAESRSQAEKVMAEFRRCRGQNLLLVMDGWDELPPYLHMKSIFQKLIAFPKELNLHLSTIIITSRPIASSDLYYFISSRIEILGFTPTEVKDYFTEALGGESQAQKLQDQLKERSLIAASCFLPLNAAIISHLFRAQNYSLPTTLHEVFTLLVVGCLKRYVAKQKGEREGQSIVSLDDLPLDLRQFFTNVYTLAYHGVMDNRVMFPLEYLKTHGLPTISETLGLMQGVESFTSLESSPSFYFLHLSVQELLASFYISKLPTEEQVLVFGKLFGEPRFAAVFRFFTAFTKLESDELRKIVAYIVQNGDKSQLLYLLHGMYEAQAPSLCQFVGSQLGGELNLRYTTLSPVDSLTVGYFISCICLTTVGEFKADLSYCSLDYYRITFFVNELSKCTSSAITQKTTGAGVSSCLELTLDLSVNRVGAEGAALLCGGSIHSLRTLDLSINNIADVGCTKIAEMLKVNKRLTSLSLRFNEIRDGGCTMIAEALKTNNSLTRLDLYYNEISEEGARAIAEALKINRSLTSLDLSGNPIFVEGGRAIAEALRVNNTLADLVLYHNAISEGARAIAEALKINRSLTTLNLYGNKISEGGARAIAEALKINQSLTSLELSENPISDEGGRAIAEALRVNSTLTRLELPREMRRILGEEFSSRVTYYDPDDESDSDPDDDSDSDPDDDSDSDPDDDSDSDPDDISDSDPDDDSDSDPDDD